MVGRLRVELLRPPPPGRWFEVGPASRRLVSTTCPGCGRAHAWTVGRTSPPQGEQVALLVPTARMWDDVVHTCGHLRIFCSNGCVDRWLDESGNIRGYVMDLNTLWHFAAHWYDGRLDHGYQRRDDPRMGLHYGHTAQGARQEGKTPSAKDSRRCFPACGGSALGRHVHAGSGYQMRAALASVAWMDTFRSQ